MRRKPNDFLIQLFAPLLWIVGTTAVHARDRVWTRLDMPNFTVISAASPAETLNWAVEFEQFHRGLGKVMELHERAIRPVTVVFFRSQSDLRPYKPLENGKPTQLEGYFSRGILGNYIAIAPGEVPAGTRLLIFHEGTHWLTNVGDTPMPLWLNEGLAEVFSTFSVENDLYSYGSPLYWHVALLASGRTIPLKELVQVENGSLLYNEGNRTSIFYAESWAFVHYLLFSSALKSGTEFNELIQALKPGLDPDQVFQKVLGCNCAEMDRRLAQYLRGGKYRLIKIKFDRAEIEREAKNRPATGLEVELAEASLLVMTNRARQALPRLKALAAQSPENLQVVETLGLASLETGPLSEAEHCLQHAADLGSRNSYVYSYLGDFTLGLTPHGIPAATPVDPSDAAKSIGYYHRALALNPLDEHAYDNIADNLNLLETVGPGELHDLKLGAFLYPTDSAIKVGLAIVDLKAGRREAGISQLKLVAADQTATPKGTDSYAQSLLEEQRRISFQAHLAQVWDEQKFDEAVALIDDELKRPLDTAVRLQLEDVRVRGRIASQTKSAVDLANDGHWEEARALLQSALDSGPKDKQQRAELVQLLSKLDGK